MASSFCRIERAADCRNGLGESPLWCPLTQRLWWLDIAAPAIWTLDAATGRTGQWPLSGPAGSLALREDGSLLLAQRKGIALLAEPAGEARPVAVAGLELGEDRCNDGKCDRAGRFWVGTMDRRMREPVGSLYRFDRPDACVRMDTGFALANGLGWSPDDRTMYFAETTSGCLYAYDYDVAHGTISGRRVFARLPPGSGGPDGLTVDAEGGVWSAVFGRGRLHRYAPDGRLDRVLPLPVSQPTSVMFGGPALDRLFVTSARVLMDDAVLAAEPLAGALLVLDPGVRGLPEPRMRDRAVASDRTPGSRDGQGIARAGGAGHGG